MAVGDELWEIYGSIINGVVFGCVYAVLALWVAFQTFRLALLAKTVRTFQVFFHVLVFILLTVRVCYFASLAITEGQLREVWVHHVFSFIPGALFGISFLCLTYFWASVAFSASGRRLPAVVKIFLVLLGVFILSVFSVLILVDALIEYRLWIVEEYVGSAFDVFVAVIFVMVWLYVYRALRKYPAVRDARRVKRRLALVTVVCVLAFCGRCFFTVLVTTLFYRGKLRDRFYHFVVIMPVFVVFCELFPLLFLLAAFYSGKRVAPEPQGLRTTSSLLDEEPVVSGMASPFYPGYQLYDEDGEAAEVFDGM